MTGINYKKTGKYGLFDGEEKTSKLSKLGNPLEKLSKVIDFELFRDDLERNMVKQGKDARKGGAPQWDVVLMFKIMVLQRIYNQSDAQMEYLITDRLSFRNFLGLSSGDKIPDEKTIWAFGDEMSKKGIGEILFNIFYNYLEEKGFYLNAGQIIDASFVEVPRQRNHKEENEKIKAGEGDQLWNDKPNKKCQKDVDARWTKKNEQKYYGYKNHVKVDVGSKLIKTYKVTDASVHDSQTLNDLLDQEDAGQNVYADSAYTGEKQDEIFEKYHTVPLVNQKGYKNKPLSDEEKLLNRLKSKIRVRVEHVFGFMENSMNGMFFRKIGKKRAEQTIGMLNLVYNLCRYEQILRFSAIK